MKYPDNGKSAELCSCTRHRFWLERWWDKSKPKVIFVSMRPGLADRFVDDPLTIRMVDEAKRLGYGSLININLFTIVIQDLRYLCREPQPMMVDNLDYLQRAKDLGCDVIYCYGDLAGSEFIREEFHSILGQGYVLGLTPSGLPITLLNLGLNQKLKQYRYATRTTSDA